MLQTILDLVKDEKRNTKGIQFMIAMMKESTTIEQAVIKIVQNIEFMQQIIHKFPNGLGLDDFYDRLIRNYTLDIADYNKPFSMKGFEIISTLEPEDSSNFIVDSLLQNLHPHIIINQDLRQRFLAMSTLHDLDWVAPLLVVTDYCCYYSDSDIDRVEEILKFMLGVLIGFPKQDLAKTIKAAWAGHR